jgi:hypothetical protein
LTSPKYITLAANDCGYGGTAKELIVTYVLPYSSRLIQLQAKLTIPVGAKPQEANLLMNIGKQLNWKLQLWKTSMLGWSLTEMITMGLPALGPSNAKGIQMDLYRSSKHGSVCKVINNLKELISLRHMHH